MVALSSKGEVADFQEADQFQPSKTQFACGFFAVAICRSMAEVGKPPTLAASQVIADAEAWYAQYDGNNAITNTAGMSLTQLYALLHQIGLHYQATAMDINVVKRWLAVDYPVIIAITETSVHDLDPQLHGANPYPWHASGTHIIVVTGVAKDGNVLVRDTANCTDLYNPNSLRPGPRRYDATKLALVSATVCVPPWMPRPASATPPAVPSVAPLAAPLSAWSIDDLNAWSMLQGKLYTEALPTTSGIASAWLHARHMGYEFGPALGPEFASATMPHISYMRFAGALAKWDHVTHRCIWIDARGAFSVPQ